jgi:hypothetical protein
MRRCLVYLMLGAALVASGCSEERDSGPLAPAPRDELGTGVDADALPWAIIDEAGRPLGEEAGDVSAGLEAPSDNLLAQTQAGNSNPRVIPPQARPHGRSYSEWSAAWWQWLWSAPVDVNPGLDETGEFVDYGQSGAVWFIAPNYGFGQSDVRYATIPPGKMLFIDIAGFFSSFEVEDPSVTTVEELRALCAEAVDQIGEIIFRVDNVPLQDIERYRVQSPTFEYVLPENNMFQWWGIPVGAGTYDPGVADGYYVMLAPLSAGEHTIYIFADLGFWGTSEVMLHLTVQ